MFTKKNCERRIWHRGFEFWETVKNYNIVENIDKLPNQPP